MPPHVGGFTTAELKVNLVAATSGGDALLALGSLVHNGQTTQLWDVTVSRERDGHQPQDMWLSSSGLARAAQWLGRRLSGLGRTAFASGRYAVNAAIASDSATIATVIVGRKP